MPTHALAGAPAGPGAVRTPASASEHVRPGARRVGQHGLDLDARRDRHAQAAEGALLAQPLGALEGELRELDGDGGLRGEDVEDLELVVRERPPLEAAQDDHARDRALVGHGHDERALGLERDARDRLEVLVAASRRGCAGPARRARRCRGCRGPSSACTRRSCRRPGRGSARARARRAPRRSGRSRTSPTGSGARGCRRSTQASPGSRAASRCRAAPRGSCRAPGRAARSPPSPCVPPRAS